MGKRPARVALLRLGLDSASPLPRHRQIYDGLREAILEGRLPPGTRLPSTRTLAAEVPCSRNTVLAAFDQLAAEGYLEGRVGAGTTVARTLPDALLQVRPGAGDRRAGRGPGRRLSRRGRLVLATAAPAPPPGPARPFRIGVPAFETFPAELWARLVGRWTAGMSRGLFEYGDPAGYRPLREAIATYVREARGVRCSGDQVIVVAGSQQGIDLAARVLLDPADQVWIEDPCYPSARAALAAAGARLCPVPVDAEGLDVAEGARRAPGARLAYVTPSHQFPLGVTMTLPRRLALLDWARRAGGWILEDDHNSEYRYASRPLASLQGLDTAGSVVYLGSFSKVLFPALRLAYLVVPAPLVSAFAAARALVDRHSPSAVQAALTQFMADGHFARHLRRMRRLYAERQEVLVAAARPLAGRLDVEPAEAGMHLVGWVPPGHDDRTVAGRAAEHGVETAPLSAYRLRSRGRGGLLLGYAGYDGPRLREGAAGLARALRPSGR